MIEIRKAEVGDVEILARVILAAENTGTEMFSYKTMFPLEEEELVKRFSKILNNEIEGHPLSYKAFLVAVDGETICGAINCYKEGVNGNSNHLITGALLSGFSRKEVQDAFEHLKPFKSVEIPKTIGTFQLDSLAVFPEYRGNRIFEKFILFLESELCIPGDVLELQVWSKNYRAFSVYERCSFVKGQISELNGNGRTVYSKKVV